MPLSCHAALPRIKGDTYVTLALAGNPNVGKSSIFNQLTGLGVVTANYPGKTVEVNIATATFGDKQIGIVDLPGTYAIGAVSEDQWVARQAVLDGKPDVVIMILDATNLPRNLFMLLQFLDLGLPIVAALNIVDQAERQGIVTNAERLSRLLGLPVIPTVATRGFGLDELVRNAVRIAERRSVGPNGAPCCNPTQSPAGLPKSDDAVSPFSLAAEWTRRIGSKIPLRRDRGVVARHAARARFDEPAPPGADGAGASQSQLRYGQDIEVVISRLEHSLATTGDDLPYGLAPRAIAILLLEQDDEFIELVGRRAWGRRVLAEAAGLAEEIAREHGEPAPVRIARERHGLAGTLAAQAQTVTKPPIHPFIDNLWQSTTAPASGIAILLVVLAGLFAFLFYVGSFLSTVFGDLWGSLVSPIVDGAIFAVFGDGIIAKVLIWGPDAGIAASLSVGIPYVLTFYFIIAVLEDTGYLNSASFLIDRLMHHLGLHGRAVIPLVAGAGCNVPAIIGTRVLTTRRERFIASVLIVLVPCSARTAVILGAVYLYAGWKAAIGIYLIVFVLIWLVGLALNKMMPGQSGGLIMEMFPFRAPSLATILKKTWHRFKDFVFVATPIVLGGSLALGALYETGRIWDLAAPLSPVVEGWLGLPAVAGLTLIFAVLRKELALQLLVALAIVQYGRGADNLLSFMNERQLFVYALVNTIYIPCVATLAVLGREMGWRGAAAIAASTIVLAVVVGGVANQILVRVG